MNYVLATLALVAFTASLGPLCMLAWVSWRDRSLPADHPDYAHVWLGKGIVYVAVGLVALFAAGMLALAIHLLK